MVYPDSVRLEICERIAKGESMVSICASEGMPSQALVYRWLTVDSEFVERYTRAREQQAEHYLDEIIAISDDVSLDEIIDGEGNTRTNNEAIQRSKLKVDTRKWAMSKLAPKKYGDSNKIDLNVSSLTELSDEQLDNIITQATERLKQNA